MTQKRKTLAEVWEAYGNGVPRAWGSLGKSLTLHKVRGARLVTVRKSKVSRFPFGSITPFVVHIKLTKELSFFPKERPMCLFWTKRPNHFKRKTFPFTHIWSCFTYLYDMRFFFIVVQKKIEICWHKILHFFNLKTISSTIPPSHRFTALSNLRS